MKVSRNIMIFSALLVLFGGCAHRYYLGMHGPSVKASPDVHEGVTEDQKCLNCHDPARNPTDPPTSHPRFTGCLKCHNDDLK